MSLWSAFQNLANQITDSGDMKEQGNSQANGGYEVDDDGYSTSGSVASGESEPSQVYYDNDSVNSVEEDDFDFTTKISPATSGIVNISALPGDELWVPHPKNLWQIAVILSVPKDRKTVKVQCRKSNGSTYDKTFPARQTFEFDEAHKQNWSDMSAMNDLHEPALLELLRKRYFENKIYTFSGDIVVSVNPFKFIDGLYNLDGVGFQQHRDSKDPHIFTVAERAYQSMVKSKRNQSILVNGESGAGKTEASKIILGYLAKASQEKAKQATSFRNAAGTLVENAVLQSNPLMEAFGNAKTIRNFNSSRFGKFIQLEYNKGVIGGASTSTFLLEKSRVTSHAIGERNYHIFYQICNGFSPSERLEYTLPENANGFKYLQPGSQRKFHVDGKDDRMMFRETKVALEELGFGRDEQKKLFEVAIIVLFLGNVVFEENNSPENKHQDASQVSKSSWDAMNAATKLLGIESRTLEAGFCKRSITSGPRNSLITIPLNPKQASQARDAFAKALYSGLFDWLVSRINQGTSSANKRKKGKFIGILDIFGFEILSHNSFEQLCVNFANEVLQKTFNHHIFELEQQRYVREGIDWTMLSFRDNQGLLDLLEKKPKGLFMLLDEQGRLGDRGSDASFLSLVNQNHSSSEFYGKNRFGEDQFIINHYAGAVTYEVNGFVAKNNDALHLDLARLVAPRKQAKCSNEFVLALFDNTSMPQGERRKMATMDTVSSRFRKNMDDLDDLLGETKPHFIRCVKPNHFKKPASWDASLVTKQLRYLGIMDTVRIRREGFPIRRDFSFITQKYRRLLREPKDTGLKWIPGKNDVACCEAILVQGLGEDMAGKKWQRGKTKMFLGNDVLSHLNQMLRKLELADLARMTDAERKARMELDLKEMEETERRVREGVEIQYREKLERLEREQAQNQLKSAEELEKIRLEQERREVELIRKMKEESEKKELEIMESARLQREQLQAQLKKEETEIRLQLQRAKKEQQKLLQEAQSKREAIEQQLQLEEEKRIAESNKNKELAKKYEVEQSEAQRKIQEEVSRRAKLESATQEQEKLLKDAEAKRQQVELKRIEMEKRLKMEEEKRIAEVQRLTDMRAKEQEINRVLAKEKSDLEAELQREREVQEKAILEVKKKREEMERQLKLEEERFRTQVAKNKAIEKKYRAEQEQAQRLYKEETEVRAKLEKARAEQSKILVHTEKKRALMEKKLKEEEEKNRNERERLQKLAEERELKKVQEYEEQLRKEKKIKEDQLKQMNVIMMQNEVRDKEIKEEIEAREKKLKRLEEFYESERLRLIEEHEKNLKTSEKSRQELEEQLEIKEKERQKQAAVEAELLAKETERKLAEQERIRVDRIKALRRKKQARTLKKLKKRRARAARKIIAVRLQSNWRRILCQVRYKDMLERRKIFAAVPDLLRPGEAVSLSSMVIQSSESKVSRARRSSFAQLRKSLSRKQSNILKNPQNSRTATKKRRILLLTAAEVPRLLLLDISGKTMTIAEEFHFVDPRSIKVSALDASNFVVRGATSDLKEAFEWHLTDLLLPAMTWVNVINQHGLRVSDIVSKGYANCLNSAKAPLQVIHYGHMLKRAVHRHSTWRDRFFLLVNNQLAWYKNESDVKPRGMIRLDYNVEAGTPKDVEAKPFCIDIMTPSIPEGLRLKAGSLEKRDNWLFAINEMCAAAKARKQKKMQLLQTDQETLLTLPYGERGSHTNFKADQFLKSLQVVDEQTTSNFRLKK